MVCGVTTPTISKKIKPGVFTSGPIFLAGKLPIKLNRFELYFLGKLLYCCVKLSVCIHLVAYRR